MKLHYLIVIALFSPFITNTFAQDQDNDIVPLLNLTSIHTHKKQHIEMKTIDINPKKGVRCVGDIFYGLDKSINIKASMEVKGAVFALINENNQESCIVSVPEYMMKEKVIKKIIESISNYKDEIYHANFGWIFYADNKAQEIIQKGLEKAAKKVKLDVSYVQLKEDEIEIDNIFCKESTSKKSDTDLVKANKMNTSHEHLIKLKCELIQKAMQPNSFRKIFSSIDINYEGNMHRLTNTLQQEGLQK